MFAKFENRVNRGWELVKREPITVVLGLAFGATIYFTWIINWGAGEWFLAYGILNVVIGFAIVAHHDYTEWKKNASKN